MTYHLASQLPLLCMSKVSQPFNSLAALSSNKPSLLLLSSS